MIPATPPPDTSFQKEQQAMHTDLSELSKDNVGDYFKSLKLRNYIEKIITKNERRQVTTAVSIVDLQSQQAIVGHNLDAEQFAASVNKLPVALLVLNDLRSGQLQMDQTLTWAPSDVRGGLGVYDQPDAPLQATVGELLFDLLNPSGNTAVRILVNQGLGGAAAVNTRWTSELHLAHTYLQPVDDNRFFLGNTTAGESLQVLRQLLAVQDTYSDFIKQALATNIYTDYGVRSQLAGNEYIVLANKVGILDDSEGNNRHDVGVVYNTRTHKAYGYAFLNTAPGEAYNTPTAQAGISLADMGKGILRYAGDKPVKDTGMQAQGKSQFAPEKKLQY